MLNMVEDEILDAVSGESVDGTCLAHIIWLVTSSSVCGFHNITSYCSMTCR